MYRRTLLSTAVAASFVPFARDAAATAPGLGPGWRRFAVTTRVALQDSPGAARLWLPVAQSSGGYQSAPPPSVQTDGRAALVRDGRYGAAMVQVVWDGGARQAVEMTQQVATRDRTGEHGDAASLTQAERRFWTAGTESKPVDGIVRETALRITAGRTASRERLRALYDWVVDNTWRDAATPGCGTGDVRAMLETGRFGGKCADINGLMVALARAAGFPARDVYGIRVADSRLSPLARPQRRREQGAALPRRGVAGRGGLVPARPGRRAKGGPGREARPGRRGGARPA